MEDNHSIFHQMQVNPLHIILVVVVPTYWDILVQAYSSGLWFGGEAGPSALPD